MHVISPISSRAARAEVPNTKLNREAVELPLEEWFLSVKVRIDDELLHAIRKLGLARTVL